MIRDMYHTKGHADDLAENLGLKPSGQTVSDERRRVWLNLGNEIGRLDGLSAAKRTALESIVTARFGTLDARVQEIIQEKIGMATLKQLDRWILLAATGKTIDDVFLLPRHARPQPGGGD